jgi:hypothetical protein
VTPVPSLRTAVDPLGLWPHAVRLGRRAGGAAADAVLDAGIVQDLVERVLQDLLERGVLHRLVATIAADPRTAALAEQALTADEAERVAGRLLGGPEAERLLTAALESPRTSELVTRMLDDAATERLVAQMLDSPLLDAAVARVLAGEELWVLVEEIARSPAVTEAIGHQGLGFADQVAGEIGARSRHADARLERMARRLLRRSPTPAAPAPPAPGPDLR